MSALLQASGLVVLALALLAGLLRGLHQDGLAIGLLAAVLLILAGEIAEMFRP